MPPSPSTRSTAVAPERREELRQPVDARRSAPWSGRLEPDPADRRGPSSRSGSPPRGGAPLSERHRDGTRRVSDPRRRPIGQSPRALGRRARQGCLNPKGDGSLSGSRRAGLGGGGNLDYGRRATTATEFLIACKRYSYGESLLTQATTPNARATGQISTSNAYIP